MCNTPFAQLWGKSEAKKPGGVREMPSQMSLACFSVITDGSVYLNIYIFIIINSLVGYTVVPELQSLWLEEMDGTWID